ncbi:ABC transporter permease subunit [Streptomyces sp. TRM43335]|uniref:ABC transporter permease subunit n=1 Tax=Streptomyces taklimakanensis TaxID=2569853 RepID=A0A6G2BEK2_9ACTN|nr:ABC transporter permease subunit [Streptomyces taklimakanensis]MTE20670.1 ABC transporter permease subunit [Streptomyces taklimakanensis]
MTATAPIPSPPTSRPDPAPHAGPDPREDDRPPRPSLLRRTTARGGGSPARHRRLLVLALIAVVAIPTAASLWGSGSWPGALTYDLRSPLEELDTWLVENRDSHWLFLYFLLHIGNNAVLAVDGVLAFLEGLGWTGVTAAATVLAWYAGGANLGRRALRTAATALGTFAVIGLLDMWEPAMETLALMAVAVAASAAVGALLGLAAGLSDRCEKVLRPVFDTMQVMPAFAYLLPFVLLFGIGTPSALIATVIYAAPPMARLTSLGLRGAAPAALEASTSLGANAWQRLWTARLPLARRQMLLGLNQTIMMCLSMVVLASMIGAGGLGDEVFTGLSRVDVGQALVPGIAIVLIAVWLDRTTAAAGERMDDTSSSGPVSRARAWARRAGAVAVVAVASVAGPAALGREWPENWTVGISQPVNTAVAWITDHLGSGIPVVGGTATWSENFARWVLNPLRDGLQGTPWWLLLLAAAALALLVGTWRTALTATAALAAIGVMGLWPASLNTLSQVLAALLVTLLLGVAVGVLAARVSWVDRAIRPVLDVMQTMPQFIYLIPVVALFNVGRTAAIIAAVVYALPAVVRITAQGIRETDPAALEAARSMGATTGQQLRQVQLPLARPALLLAVNQGVVLVLAIVVIGGLVGGGALGYDVVYALQKSELGIGLTSGAAIVCLGVFLDRITQPASARDRGARR